ncbi:MAG: aminotransferase class V-fold PLP-dependent enzyme [candidate division Zixibacteria bacterium]|nr:aminotransferase class V-fold PLP-dependent enzyme [candidate division Zixibacteria bacterium]
MKRRRFFNTIGVLAGASILTKPSLLNADVDVIGMLRKSDIKDLSFWKTVREQFIFPRDYIYLNTGGIGAVPSVVLDKVCTTLNKLEEHPKPGHDLKTWLKIKSKCRRFIGNKCLEKEIALISSATEGINIILNGLPLEKGDEIITTVHEHPALNIPLLNKMKNDGIVLKTFDPDLTDGINNVNLVNDLISERTKLIFISHITCIMGQILPVAEIGELARSRNILFAVDGAQAVGMMPLDINPDVFDFYTSSGHKWTLGPKRTGILIVRKQLFDVLKPTTVGAYSDKSCDIVKQDLELYPTAQRYEYGTRNEALFHGLDTGLDLLLAIGLKNVQDHNISLAEYFCSKLSEIPSAVLMSPSEKQYRSAIITFRIEGTDTKELISFLKDSNIRVRRISEIGLDGIRLSFHIYNNEEEIDFLISRIELFVDN